MLGKLGLLNLNCRSATRLASDASERPLHPLERTGLAIHMLGCRKCRRYRQQIKLLDALLKVSTPSDVQNISLTFTARERIRQRLTDV